MNPSTTDLVGADRIAVRPAQERGQANHGWLSSRHSFSFGDYFDPRHMGFRSLRVINDDQVAPRMGFGTHPHRNMEIFSYVLKGTIEHKDSLGNGRQLRPGEIQLMSAGTGVSHSEFNPSSSEALHFLQIWIEPRENGLTPSYSEWHPAPEHATQAKVLVISSDGRDHSAKINQDADVYRVRLEAGQNIKHDLEKGRGLWLQIALGGGTLNGVALGQGDGASSEAAGSFIFQASEPTDALLFDLG